MPSEHTRRRAARGAAAALGAALALAAAETPAGAEPETATRLQVSEKEPYGEYLVDGEGASVYLFEKDRKGVSTCTEACAEAWPPVLVQEGDGGVPHGSGVEGELVSTFERPNGTTQLLYAGKPLYYFHKDARPGQTRGQDVHEFGGGWYLLSPEGEKIEASREGSAE